jgi:hypothetical protein
MATSTTAYDMQGGRIPLHRFWIAILSGRSFFKA